MNFCQSDLAKLVSNNELTSRNDTEEKRDFESETVALWETMFVALWLAFFVDAASVGQSTIWTTATDN